MASREREVREAVATTLRAIGTMTVVERDLEDEEPLQLNQYPGVAIGRAVFEEDPMASSEDLLIEVCTIPLRYAAKDYSAMTTAENAAMDACQTIRNALLDVDGTYQNLGLNYVMPGSLRFTQVEILSRYPRAEAEFGVECKICFDPTNRGA